MKRLREWFHSWRRSLDPKQPGRDEEDREFNERKKRTLSRLDRIAREASDFERMLRK